MTESSSPTRRFRFSLVAASLLTATTTLLVPAAQQASADTPNCTAYADAPIIDKSGNQVVGQGGVTCAARQSQIQVEVTIFTPSEGSKGEIKVCGDAQRCETGQVEDYLPARHEWCTATEVHITNIVDQKEVNEVFAHHACREEDRS